MLKEKMQVLRNYIVKNSKVVYPILVIFAVAITVIFALKMRDIETIEEPIQPLEVTAANSTAEASFERVITEIPLELNTNAELYTLIATYYNAYALGDVETIKSLTNYMDETDEIKIPEMSKYIVSYPLLEIYTKPGPQENSYLTYVYFHLTFSGYDDAFSGMETFYVCTDESGELYFNEGEVSADELEYIRVVNLQDDVIELYNRVNVECSEAFLNNAEIFYYVQEFVNEVQKSTGEILAAQVIDQTEENLEEDVVTVDSTQVHATDEILTAIALDTVNVRSSDSEQAERIGKINIGTSVQVVEQRVNGWSKIVFENKDGFIKSEFLQVAIPIDDSQIIGTLTATTNINVRMAPNETAEKLGVLSGGESIELIARENGWCQIRYNGQSGYVKEDYVQ